MYSGPAPTDTANTVARIVRTVMAESRPALLKAALTGRRGESENLRHEGNFLSEHDLRMHDRYRDLFAESLGSFVYASEEDDPLIVGPATDPDLLILVDPLDTSELAVRALHGYTHVLLYSRSLRRPVAAVVGDIYHHVQLFIGCRHDDGEDRAYLITADDDVHRLSTRRTPVTIPQALITNYLMRPAERLQPIARQQALIDALTKPDADGPARGRIGVDFGSISLCHVAAGQTDATVEFAKGFAVWDLSPGHYILRSAGGCVIDLHGKELPLDYGLDSLKDIAAAMKKRRTFIAAGAPSLAHEILACLEP